MIYLIIILLTILISQYAFYVIGKSKDTSGDSTLAWVVITILVSTIIIVTTTCICLANILFGHWYFGILLAIAALCLFWKSLTWTLS